MSEKLIIYNIDGTTTEVEPLKACDPRETCPVCLGSGELAGCYSSNDGMTTCENCNGTGLVYKDAE